MEDNHIGFSQSHLLCIQDESIFQTLVLGRVVETLLLYASHVQNIEKRHCFFDSSVFAVVIAQFVLHIVRQTKLFRRDEYEVYALVTLHGFDERVDGTTILEVATKTDCQVVKMT